MRLVLVRHTSVSGVQGICYGRTDVALAESFEADAASVRAALPPGPWALVTSPARRCLRLAATFGTDMTIDARLDEIDFGGWDGRAWDDLPRAMLDRWCADFVNLCPPGGESFADLAVRAEMFVEDMSGRLSGGTLVAVTHAGVIRALLAPRRSLPYAEAFSIAVPHGSVHVLEISP